MRETLRDRERLKHIVEAADNIIRYTEGKKHGYDIDEICKINGVEQG